VERVGSSFAEGQAALAAHGRSGESRSRLLPTERHGIACDHTVCCPARFRQANRYEHRSNDVMEYVFMFLGTVLGIS